MKTKAKALFLVAVVAATVGGHALSQPADTQPSAKIDPYSGLPTGPGLTVSNSTTKSINPATGLPQANGDDLAPLLQAQAFTASGQYEQALQCFLRLDAQAQATTNSLTLSPSFVVVDEFDQWTGLFSFCCGPWVECEKIFLPARD